MKKRGKRGGVVHNLKKINYNVSDLKLIYMGTFEVFPFKGSTM